MARSRSTWLATLVALLPALGSVSTGCTTGEITGADAVQVGDVGDDAPLSGVVENPLVSFATDLQVGDDARVCGTGTSGLRQRSDASTSATVLRVMPEGTTVKILASSAGWFQNDWGGRQGWSFGQFLCKVTPPPVTPPPPTPPPTPPPPTGGDLGFDSPLSVAGALAIAQAGVGFSYYWGGARFVAGGAHGACYGSCPSCTHSGSYGADCSGYIGKVWRLPEAMPMDSNKHPFSTYNFYNESEHWSHIARSSTVAADALTYNSGGAGHIFLYEKGDPWGSLWSYEARGCSYGVVHNLRTAGTAYHAIHRTGI